MKNEYKLSYVATKNANYDGLPDEVARFVIKNQLLDKNAWNHFVYAYKNNVDIPDKGWRGEYWGKMMRGACLTYMYTGDEELYNVLTEAAIDMLHAETARGTFTTYNIESEEFQGWDMWCRKYILTGFQHYYDICRDEVLKGAILKALCEHADYICKKIGNGEGQKEITKTSNFWLGVNSCSILEPMLRLYDMTKDKKYLDFADYIISTGGIDHEDNLIDLAIENVKKPYQDPENKAYETMSFFEGVLCYYELFGKEEYLTAVTNFVEAVYETDITVIGCAGCTHELFDNSALRQTEDSETVKQETCVTVTWMRLLARLYRLTGEAKYMERIERSALNAMYGSINVNMLWQGANWGGGGETGNTFVFDSYSPLCNGRRSLGIGGFKVYEDGFSYGCCACIGSAGTALYPLLAVTESENGIVIGSLWNGTVKARTPNGTARLEICGGYPLGGGIKVKVGLSSSESFEIRIRVPENCVRFDVSVGGVAYKAQDGFVTVSREFSDGDVIDIVLENALYEVKLGGKAAFMYGPVVLARDCAKEGEAVDLTEAISPVRVGDALRYELVTPEKGEMLRVLVSLADGGTLLLTDYASCGKKWNDENCMMTVWFNLE